ncbi:hypothetical protein FF021_11805, partial [Leptospira noguchii]
MKEIKTKRFDGGRVPLASDALCVSLCNRLKIYLLIYNYLKRVLRYPLAGKYFCALPGPGLSGSSHILRWNLSKVVALTFYERLLISATRRNNADALLAYVCLALYGSLISATRRNNADALLAYVCLALYGS